MTPTQIPRLSIIVPTYNRRDLLERCTAALRRQDLQAPYEIVIADDGSRDGALEFAAALAREDPRVRHVRGRHAGAAAAKNRGIRSARGELVAFIDDDWIVAPDFARRAVAFFDPHPERLAMASRMVASSESPFVERVNHFHYETDMRLLLERRNAFGHHLRNFLAGTHYPFRPQAAPYISASGGLVLRRAVLDVVGVFDEDLAIGEDTDLAWRMRARGITLFYNPAIEIVHHYRPTLRASLRQQFSYGIGLRDFVRKRPDHFALLPSTPRGALRFASNLVMRPVKKALQTESTGQLLAYLPPLFLLNAAYTAGVLYGMSRRPVERPAVSTAVPRSVSPYRAAPAAASRPPAPPPPLA
jgi:GT2 family glycosyltransferase